MGRYRSHSRSYSPPRYSRSPPRRKRYDDPRDRYRGGGGGGREYRDYRSAPSGLLIRNIALDARSEDLRIPFERFGPVKDVYLPKNYYTGEPRGFGFVKFRYAEDAAVAKQHMNRQIIGGREISIVYAEENRKTPQEMHKMARVSERYRGGRNRRSTSRSPRRQYHSYSRSPSPPRHGSRREELEEEEYEAEEVNKVEGEDEEVDKVEEEADKPESLSKSRCEILVCIASWRRKATCGSSCLSLVAEEEWLAACLLCLLACLCQPTETKFDSLAQVLQ